jgi:hypothetical protein
MEWGRAAAHDNHNFNPTRALRNAQVKYLEKWLQFQKSRPQQVPTHLPGPPDQVVQTTCFGVGSCFVWEFRQLGCQC